MEQISEPDIQARISRDNPWWSREGKAAFVESNLPRRVYFDAFAELALNYAVKRAAILLGPRRVGKTVMIKQTIEKAIDEGMDRSNVLYASIDTPLYSNTPLESFLHYLPAIADGQPCLVVFDEIQYLKDWQIHLKDLVDSYPNVKFIASGSAAAALSLQSKESGAGRFSDFMLPPLTFSEFLDFSNRSDLVQESEERRYQCDDIESLNAAFLDYLNFGGYPEAVLNPEVRSNPDQFIRTDIIEKVLLKDLPSLYGINDIQELNKLFMFLAYNAGNEASYENLSQESGITKPMIKKYIEYLESAFLIIKLSTVNDTCRSMQRERNFKVYLNNPSMRAALFSPIAADDTTLIGHLAECAVFSQWQHAASFRQLRYARWRNLGEVDAVYLLPGKEKPLWIGEVKWSDQYAGKPNRQVKHLRHLLGKHDTIESAFLTTRTIAETTELDGRPLTIWPTALYCYTVGKNTTSDLSMALKFGTKTEA
ncbi:MAG: ATP-binding protein [Pseudomonadota bacterium]